MSENKYRGCLTKFYPDKKQILVSNVLLPCNATMYANIAEHFYLGDWIEVETEDENFVKSVVLKDRKGMYPS